MVLILPRQSFNNQQLESMTTSPHPLSGILPDVILDSILFDISILMIGYIILRMGGVSFLESIVAIMIVVTIAMAPPLSGLFVSSFTITPTTTTSRQLFHRIPTTQLHVSSTSPPTAPRTTSAATLSYLNSLQSITSNPQLFPATSDTIEALLLNSSEKDTVLVNPISPKDFLMNLSREVMQASSSSTIEEEVEEVAADTAVEQLQGGRHSSPLITDSVNPIMASSSPAASTSAAVVTTGAGSSISSPPNNSVNLISEGMTAEEAAAIRMNRLQPSSSLHSQQQTTTTTEKEVNNKEVDDNNTMISPNKAKIISEGMTAEEAQQTRMARLHQSSSTALPPPTATETTATTIKNEDEEVVPIMTNKPISSIPQKNNNRGVSGLKQAAAKPSYTPSMPSSRTSTTAVGGAAFVSSATASTLPRQEEVPMSSSSSSNNQAWDNTNAYNNDDDDDILNDELLTAASSSSRKFLGVPISNPNTPLIATSTGIATGILSYEVMDEYAYQFNTWHNGMIVDGMDRYDEFVEKWDELIGAYYKVPVEEGGDATTFDDVVDAANAAAAPMEFSDAASSDLSATASPDTSMVASTTTNEVTMDQGGSSSSVINTPVEAASSSDSVVTNTVPTMEFSDTSDVVVAGAAGSEATITTAPTSSLDAATASPTMQHADTATTEISPVVPSLNEVTSVDEGGVLNGPPVTTAAEPMQYGGETMTLAAPSLNEVTVDEGVMNAAPSALSYGSGNTDNVLADVTASAPVEATQYSDVAGVGTITAAPSSLNEANVVDEGTTNTAPVTSYYDSGNDQLLVDGAPTEPTHYSDITGVEVVTNTDHQDVVTAPASSSYESSYESGNTELLADATTSSAPAEQAQYYDTTAAQDVTNAAPASTFESGNTNTELLADATTSAPVASTQYSDVSGADTATASIDQGVMSASSASHESGGNFDLLADASSSSAPTVADSTHQQRWFTAPPSDQYATHVPSTSDGYTHTDYATTFDQGSYSGGSFSYGGGSNGGSFTPESYSTWHPQGGGSNPLRELAASLPPPVDRVRGTGGDYYREDVGSQWVAMQGDGFQTLADTPPVSGMDGLVDGLQSTDFSNAPNMGSAEFADVVPNSFTTQSPDISYDHIFNGADKVESTDFAHAMDSIRDNVDFAAQSQQFKSLSEFASSSGASVNDALMSAEAKLFGSVSHSLGEIQGKVSAGASSMKGLGNGAHAPVDTHMVDGSLFQNAGETFQMIHPPAVVSSAIQHAGDASIADIGDGILNAVKFMAGILLTVVDANLDLAAPGSSSALVLENVQASVNSMLDNASYTVMNVINDVGNLSLKDIVHNLMVLIVATADMLMKVMNAVIYLLSGKDTGSWALQATSTVNQASSQLLAQADDVTHRSIGDLASSIGDYSYHVGNELVALLGSLNGVEGAHFDGTFDMVTTAMQTGFTM